MMGRNHKLDLPQLHIANKQHHRTVLLRSFHLNGHILGFYPQTQKLESPCTAWSSRCAGLVFVLFHDSWDGWVG